MGWPLPLVLVLFFIPSSTTVLVSSPRGLVRGFHVDLGNETGGLFYGQADVFLGIPFAQPPTGERRFKLPLPICSYGQEVQATENKPRCPQTADPNDSSAFNQSEDCLHLNVYTPDASRRGEYPVMVYIHGGTFTTGGADIYAWKGAVRNLVSRGVVVVALQYRLGLLGFFTTFSSSFPPNRGLFDILTALQWVQEEIEAFGGNPDRVTVFGESAGGTAVSALSLSPLSHGLFHRTIQQSGSVLQEHDIPDDPRGSIHKTRAKQAQRICSISDDDWNTNPNLTTVLSDCFHASSLDQLNQFDMRDNLNWCVTRDGAILSDSPSSLASSRPRRPALIGDTRDEFAFFMEGFSTGNLSDINRASVRKELDVHLPFVNASTKDDLVSLMAKSYHDGALADGDYMNWARVKNRAFTGLGFSSLMRRDAAWHREHGNENVFLYTFDYASPICGNLEAEGWRPVGHTDDLCFLWFFADSWESAEKTGKLTWKDFAVADHMGRTWTDFAKGRNPVWPAATEQYNYASINVGMDWVGREWREVDHVLYNVVLPDRVDEWPRTTITEEWEKKLKAEGLNILEDWKAARESCLPLSSSSSPPPATSSQSSLSSPSTTPLPPSDKSTSKSSNVRTTTSGGSVSPLLGLFPLIALVVFFDSQR